MDTKNTGRPFNVAADTGADDGAMTAKHVLGERTTMRRMNVPRIAVAIISVFLSVPAASGQAILVEVIETADGGGRLLRGG